MGDNTASQVEATLTTITHADLQLYDQTELTGAEVLEAYYTFQGQPIAFLVHNVSMEHGLKTYIPEDKNPKTIDPSLYAIDVERVKDGTETIENIQFLNYNEILESNEQGALPTELAKTGVLV